MRPVDAFGEMQCETDLTAEGGRMKNFLTALLFVLLMSIPALSQDNDRENFQVEFTGFYWHLRPSGNVIGGSTTVDLRSDLGITQYKGQFISKLVYQYQPKNSFVVEAIPYRLHGENV